MSTVLRPKYNPESYDPKMKPAIINKLKALKAETTIQRRLPNAKMLDGIMSPDKPWVGSCRYLLCFTPLFMHIEKHNTNYYADSTTREDFNYNFGLSGEDSNIAFLNRERIYKVFLTVTGMGLINHWSNIGEHHNYEVAKDYVSRSMRFAGYQYEVVNNTDKDIIMDRIKCLINSNIPVLAYYKSGWELIIGYDEDDENITLRKDDESIKKSNYTDELEYLICVTDTDCGKSDLKTVISDIIETMETSGEGIGMQGYYEAIDYLKNDDLFNNADEETIKSINGSLVWGYFIGHAESRGFSGQGFSWRFLNRNTEDMTETLNKLSYYGDQHHQIAWCGQHLIGDNFDNLRDKSIRDKMIYVIYSLIENDMMICRLLKELISLKTPDILMPLDKKTGKVLSTQIETSEPTIYKIMEKLKSENVMDIDFNKDIEPWGEMDWKIQNGMITIKCDNDWSSMALKKETKLPFKVDIRVKTDSTNIHLYYGLGAVTFDQWRHLPGELRIQDIATKLDFGYPGKSIILVNQFMDISWIVHRDFMAVVVNGELRYYGINHPYMNIDSLFSEKIRFGAAKGSTITVAKLTVSELE